MARTIMKICFDEQIFLLQKRGGVSRYFTELIRAFQRSPSLNIEPLLPFRWSSNVHVTSAGLVRPAPRVFGGHRRAIKAMNVGYRLLAHRADLIHHTYYGPVRQFGGDKKPRVVTVYDMIPEIMPELFPSGNPHQAKREYVANADLVICISQSTFRDLVACYGPVEAAVVVTPLGVDPAFAPGNRELPGWPDHYLLFVGARSLYKDFSVLAKAFAQIAPRHPKLMLVAVGGGPFTPAEESQLREHGIRTRVMQRDLDEPGLARAYSGASAFVFPSRYEGFGLPTLEAMASGCPAILANSSSLPEVGGDAGAYFPVGDSDALAGVLEDLLGDVRLRSELVARGLERAKHFTWARTGELTAQAYRTLLDLG